MNYPAESSREGWLLFHSVGLFSRREGAVRAALDNFGSNCRLDLQRWDYGLAARQPMREQWATLMGTPAAAIFAAENVTETIASFVGALDRRCLVDTRGTTVRMSRGVLTTSGALDELSALRAEA